MPPLVTYERNGVVMTTGAEIRPRDRAEDRYHLLATTAPLGALWDESTPILPFCDQGRPDDRLAYDDGQQNLGACVAFTAREAAYMCGMFAARRAGFDVRVGDIIPLHPGIVYEDFRKAKGWWPGDSGAFAADVMDLILAGGSNGPAFRYYADARYEYPRSLWDGRERRDYVLSHRPFYPTDGNIWQNLATALLAGFPVMAASYWPRDWFNPSRGIVGASAIWTPQDGGHEWGIWGLTRTHALCCNHWTEAFTRDATDSGLPMMRPGDFAVPRQAFERPDTPIFELRAISFEAVAPAPIPPDPNPEPEPNPTPPAPADRWDLAVAAGRTEAADMAVYAGQKPASIARKWWHLGGEWMVAKIAAAKPGAEAGPAGERPK